MAAPVVDGPPSAIPSSGVGAEPGGGTAPAVDVGPAFSGGAPHPVARSSRRTPIVLGGVLLAAVAIGAAAAFGGLLPGQARPGTGAPAGGRPPAVTLTPLEATPVAANGSPVTDAHGVTITVATGSVVNASAVRLATSSLPDAFDAALTSGDGWKRTSPVYSIETDPGSDVIGTVPLSFPASGPDDRVAALLDRRHFVVLGVEPVDGRLTIRASAESPSEPAFDGEGDHYFVVAKASAGRAREPYALARMSLTLAPSRPAPGGGPDMASSRTQSDCEFAYVLHEATCWNDNRSISITQSWLIKPEEIQSNDPQTGAFIDRVTAIMRVYNSDLLFNGRIPSAEDPIHFVIEWDPTGESKDPGDPRYRPNLIVSPKIYIGMRPFLDIDEPAHGQLVAHELFHWLQHGKYAMRVDGHDPHLYWGLEVRAEAASFLVSQAYQPVRLLKVGAILADTSGAGTQGVLGWQTQPFTWSLLGTDPWRYVQGQVVRLGLCDDKATCIESEKVFAWEVNNGMYSFQAPAYRQSLKNTAIYLLGGLPAGIQADTTATVLQSGRGIGDYIHASLSPITVIPPSFVKISSFDNLSKDPVPGKVAIHATIESGGIYPLRVSNGSDIPRDNDPDFAGKSVLPDAPYSLHLDPGVELYYRVGSGPVVHLEKTGALDLSPITSTGSVKVRQADGSWADKPGFPSIRIVAINDTEGPVTLNGVLTPLPPLAVATPATLGPPDPTTEVMLAIDMSQVTRNIAQASFIAEWEFGDGSPVVRAPVIVPVDQTTVSFSQAHTFTAPSSGVRVTFLDKDGKALPWDPVVIPVTTSPTVPATGGGWVLAASEPRGGPNASSSEADGEKRTVDSASGRIVTSYAYTVAGDRPASAEDTVTWGPPPASTAPGDPWTSVLSARQTCGGDTESWRLENANLGVAAPGIAGDSGVRASCTNGSGTTNLSWTFPGQGATAGGTFEIVVSGGGAGGSDAWTYRYEWRP